MNASHWNPTYGPLDAIIGLIVLFVALAVPFSVAVFWLRALPAVTRALTQTTIAAHGGPVVVRDTPAIAAARHNAERAAARYSHA